MKQPRRALDVREEEGHSPGRKVPPHRNMMRQQKPRLGAEFAWPRAAHGELVSLAVLGRPDCADGERYCVVGAQRLSLLPGVVERRFVKLVSGALQCVVLLLCEPRRVGPVRLL